MASRMCTEADFVFLDKRSFRITDVATNVALIHSIRIALKVQKNRRNGQKITWTMDLVNPRLCIVKAAICIYLRSLKYDPEQALTPGLLYKEKGKVKYITGRKVNTYFKQVAQKVYPDITKEELSQYSSHMWRVTACVLL